MTTSDNAPRPNLTRANARPVRATSTAPPRRVHRRLQPVQLCRHVSSRACPSVEVTSQLLRQVVHGLVRRKARTARQLVCGERVGADDHQVSAQHSLDVEAAQNFGLPVRQRRQAQSPVQPHPFGELRCRCPSSATLRRGIRRPSCRPSTWKRASLRVAVGFQPKPGTPVPDWQRRAVIRSSSG